MPKATSLLISTCQITSSIILSKLYTLILKSLLGSVEALARQNARSDRVCLELFCCFFLSREKSKTRCICKRSSSQQIRTLQHQPSLLKIYHLYPLNKLASSKLIYFTLQYYFPAEII